MSLTTDITITMSNTLSKTLDLSSPSDVLSLSKQYVLASGTSDDQADLMWHDKRTIDVSDTINDDIDLAGSLKDALGDTFTPLRIKALYIENLSTLESLRVGPAAVANPWNTWIGGTQPYVIVPPSGALLLVAPKATAFTVTAGTGDILRVTANPGSVDVDYNIVVIGASA